MHAMFSSDWALRSLDVSGFDTSNVTDMGYMFADNQSAAGTKGLSTIDGLTDFNTSKVTDMSAMFYSGHYSSLDLSSFDTRNVTTMRSMFLVNTHLESIRGLQNFKTPKLTDLAYAFDTVAVSSLDLSGFDTSHVTDMSSMFTGSSLLNTIKGIENFDVSQVMSMSGIFTKTALTSLDLTKWKTVNVQGGLGVSLPSTLREFTVGSTAAPGSPLTYRTQINGLQQANGGREQNGYTGKWALVVDSPIANNGSITEYDAPNLQDAINQNPRNQSETFVWERYRDVTATVSVPDKNHKVDGNDVTLRSHGYSASVPQTSGAPVKVERFVPVTLPAGPTRLRYANGDRASYDYAYAGWKDTSSNASYAVGAQMIPENESTTVASQWTRVRDGSALNDEVVNDSNLVQKDYVSSTWSPFDEALTAANKALDDASASQTAIDNALKDLTSARNGLELMPNKLALTTLLDMANAKHQDDYRPSTWSQLSEAVKQADAVNANVDATGSDVNSAVKALKRAINGLERKADMSGLTVLVNKAAAVHQADYTAESWNALSPALSAAQDVLGNDDATQKDVNVAQNTLLAALSGLEKPQKVVIEHVHDHQSASNNSGQGHQADHSHENSQNQHGDQNHGNGQNQHGNVNHENGQDQHHNQSHENGQEHQTVQHHQSSTQPQPVASAQPATPAQPAVPAPTSQPTQTVNHYYYVSAPSLPAQPATVNRVVVQRPKILPAPVIGAQNSTQGAPQNDSTSDGDTIKTPKKESGKRICKMDNGHYATMSKWVEPASSSDLPMCSVLSSPQQYVAPKSHFDWWILVDLILAVATVVLGIMYYRSTRRDDQDDTVSEYDMQ
ncbi:BspA family leucine-rich repeat surface protein [Bifidobacterium sp. ESL0682]|uniref:BspA family leucine-rich repeat surface protein n=1 Tax=Bifidobacterium sp. ESL0682 TaxID=2983212 RepID=UPI0023F79912|nr:BspA family leucine-rich repeat surface protein [Bifidobacterium sp. ESL0682]WEV42781.1 BspA family leucine-rich repeat surface protein [Bifidobacterium sp. ESL0682]